MSETDIPLGASDYYRKAAGNPAVMTKNVYFEVDPTNTEKQTSLIRRPGLRKLLILDDGPIDKIYYRPDTFDNNFFVVSNRKLFRVARTGDSDFASAFISPVLAATGNVSIVSSSDTLFVTDETTLSYTDGSAPLTSIATPDDVKISRLAYVSGHLICVVKNSQRFYWIKPGEVTIDPLNFAEAEGLPDGIVDVIVLGDQVYFFGKETIEVWYLTGDSDTPFSRLQGKLMSMGALKDTSCLVAGNDAFFFIASDGTARIGPGMDKVSNSGIEERFRKAIKEQFLTTN